MKQSLPYDTYAVSLLFDEAAAVAIADAVQALARETGNDRLTAPAVPPRARPPIPPPHGTCRA